jgi:hypothetical protein
VTPEQQRTSHDQHNHEDETDPAGQNVENSATHQTAPIGEMIRDDRIGLAHAGREIGAGEALARRG